VRLKPKQSCPPEFYKIRKASLIMLEKQAQQGIIDLFFGDETQFSEQGYVPYAWQFDNEDVSIKACRGRAINCFGLFSRTNQFFYRNSKKNINAAFIIETLDELSFKLRKPTVIVLDNARVHTARKIKELLKVWQTRGLYIFYLPPYSPHLNIIERLWKEMKQAWIKPEDYVSADNLFYAVDRVCAAIGNQLFLRFSKPYF
jgi:transposase